jgi:hypothetical protein
MQHSTEEAAAKFAAHLGLSVTGFELIPTKKHAAAVEK